MSIRLKFFLTYVLVATVPLILVSALNYLETRDALVEREIITLEAIAESKVRAIKDYLNHFERELLVAQDYVNVKKNLPVLLALAETPADPLYLEAKEQLDGQFKLWNQKRKDIVDLMLVGPDGRIVYVSNEFHSKEDLGNYLPDPDGKTFQNGKERVYISDLFPNPVEDGRPTILAAAPVTDFDSQFTGLIVFEVNTAEFYALIQDTTGLGKTGETQLSEIVSDDDPRIIDKTSFDGQQVVFLNPLRFDPTAAFQRVLPIKNEEIRPSVEAANGKNGSGLSIDYRNNEVLAVWRYIPSRNWGLVAKIDYQEVLEPASQLLSVFALLLTVALLLIILFAWFTSGVTARSVKETEKARAQSEEARELAAHRLKEAERLNAVMVDRELKMVELKEELKKYQHNI